MKKLVPNIHAQGHNKWSKVKHTKGAKDAKRGKLFSKISLEIVSSIKAGGADASVNGRLAAALSKAKHAMMPKDSVDVAIKKVMLVIYIFVYAYVSQVYLQATSKSSSDAVEDVIYEGYGPGGVAMIMYGFYYFFGCEMMTLLASCTDYPCSETVTDKRARTIKEVKEILNRLG